MKLSPPTLAYPIGYIAVILGIIPLILHCNIPSPPTSSSPSPTPASLSKRRDPIINGQVDLSLPAVGAFSINKTRNFCTGTLIAKKVVITAAHCVKSFQKFGGIKNIYFRVDIPSGTNSYKSQFYELDRGVSHPNFSFNSSNLSQNDIALVILKREVLNVTPLAVNTAKMDSSWVGKMVKAVGYGLIQTRPYPILPNEKYSADIPIYRVEPYTFIHFDTQTKKSACHGDSGGPALFKTTGQWIVLGVTSTSYKAKINPNKNPPTFCDGGTRVTRADVHYSSFIKPLLDLYRNNGRIQPCIDGQTEVCYTGPSQTLGVGVCKPGTRTCQNGKWSPCRGEVTPHPLEICHNQKDDNCNGVVDEGCPECSDGERRTCYSGPPNTSNVGICKPGVQFCRNGKWSECTGQILPAPSEICLNQKDDNCNGVVDEGCPECSDGERRTCYSGPPNTSNVGICKPGVQFCQDGKWSECTGQTLPAPSEVCGNQIDDNCNGIVDEGCEKRCREGSSRPCYSGPAGTENKGLCRRGVQTCRNGRWSPCRGEILPKEEICSNKLDDDCDGQVDENCHQYREISVIPKRDGEKSYIPRGFGCQIADTEPDRSFLIELLFIICFFYIAKLQELLRQK